MKIIFWNVDTQKDFMNPDGALYVEGAETIKPNLKKLTDFAKKKHIMVVNTCDVHLKDDEELSDNPDFINTFPPHCMFREEGSAFIEETNPEDSFSVIRYISPCKQKIWLDTRNIIIHKNKFDVFEGNPCTSKVLDLINPDEVIVYGVATNVCVNCAVLGLANRGIRVHVVSDAIKELPKLPLKDIYDNWKRNYIVITDTKSVLKEIKWRQ